MIKSIIDKLYPPATLGVIGGGQLGRMFVFEAKRMGYHVVVLDPKVNSPAGQVADEQIVAGFDELWAYRELASKTDVITFEFEHINAELLTLIENEGFKVIPSSKTLEVIQHKYKQKTMLRQIGVKVPESRMISSLADLKKEFQFFNQKAILKSCTNGYDGKGNMIIENEDDIENAYQQFGGQEIFIEELIDFIKEVSIIVVKNDSGVYFYPVVENIHQNSILIKTLIPASLSDDVITKIRVASEKIVEELNDFGVFCIEFFIDKNLDVIVNEIAPRPHNSGHYSIECCVTSQFEQLVRVICGMPIGATHLIKPCVMYNILGSHDAYGKYVIRGLDAVLNIPDCHFHLYGKQETNYLKKIGHITVSGETVDIADEKAKIALQNIRINSK
ncbi:MAG: 5-(carboxyamino)imidazole ribonucleotide synthase [Ignavibacteria bacterium]|nr:5-(carboxyamino)imidazole ribonucleotide synthase [Ignavibacteria bacterium]